MNVRFCKCLSAKVIVEIVFSCRAPFQTFKVPYPVVDAQKHALAEPVPAKPHGRGSSLPRPISTGIPRPVSRIPGLRTLK